MAPIGSYIGHCHSYSLFMVAASLYCFLENGETGETPSHLNMLASQEWHSAKILENECIRGFSWEPCNSRMPCMHPPTCTCSQTEFDTGNVTWLSCLVRLAHLRGLECWRRSFFWWGWRNDGRRNRSPFASATATSEEAQGALPGLFVAILSLFNTVIHERSNTEMLHCSDLGTMYCT